MSAPRRIGLLGGAFDPPHVGHLVLARSALEALKLDELRLMPSGQPWQKPTIRTHASDRANMARLALADYAAREPAVAARLSVDDRETRRAGDTYTIDTLAELRAEHPDACLVWVMGSDQFANLPTWRRWRELLDLAHLAVVSRGPGGLDALPDEVEALLRDHGREALPDARDADAARDTPGAAAFRAGSIVLFRMPPVPISSTVLRERLSAGERPAELVAAPVLAYIERKRLY